MFILRMCGPLLARQLFIFRHGTSKSSLVMLSHLPLRRQHYTGKKPLTSRGYKIIGYQKYIEPNFSILYKFVVCFLFAGSIMYWNTAKNALLAKAAEFREQQREHQRKRHLKRVSDNKEIWPNKRQRRASFRRQRIIQYENRLRQYSTPDKVFRYFATVRISTPKATMICMTPDDFLRSICPGMKQPDGLGLDRYKNYDPESFQNAGRQCTQLNDKSIFKKFGTNGLITFSDYIFLLTVLSTTPRLFVIAFQLFDMNGDGLVDKHEFEMVNNVLRLQSCRGSRSSDFEAFGDVSHDVNTALKTYFFGPHLDKKLTVKDFLDFQQELQHEILFQEFERKNPNNRDAITEVNFALLLLAYSKFPSKLKQEKLARVRARFYTSNIGISRQEYVDFFHFLNNIEDVNTALHFHNIAGAAIDGDTFKHVAKTVAKVELSNHLVDVILTIFDDNNDQLLSHEEFIAVMLDRIHRDLEKPKDTGAVSLMQAVLKCTSKQITTPKRLRQVDQDHFNL